MAHAVFVTVLQDYSNRSMGLDLRKDEERSMAAGIAEMLQERGVVKIQGLRERGPDGIDMDDSGEYGWHR